MHNSQKICNIYRPKPEIYFMKKSTTFFNHFFLAVGIIWFLSALSIVVFKLNFQTREIILTLIFPLAYALLRLFDNSKPSEIE